MINEFYDGFAIVVSTMARIFLDLENNIFLFCLKTDLFQSAIALRLLTTTVIFWFLTVETND